MKKDGNEFKMISGILSIFFAILFLFWLIYFKYYKESNFSEWLTLILTVSVTFSGGFLTMLGVLYTIKDTKKSQEKIKTDEVNQLAYIVYEELYAYLTSLLNLNMNILNNNIRYYWDKDISKTNNILLDYGYIYELIPDIKVLFYKIVSSNPNIDKKYIKIFIDIISDYNKVQLLKKHNDEVNSKDTLNNLGVEVFRTSFLDSRSFIYGKLNYELYTELYKQNKDLEDRINDEAAERMSMINSINNFSYDVQILLDFLKDFNNEKNM